MTPTGDERGNMEIYGMKTLTVLNTVERGRLKKPEEIIDDGKHSIDYYLGRKDERNKWEAYLKEFCEIKLLELIRDTGAKHGLPLILSKLLAKAISKRLRGEE